MMRLLAKLKEIARAAVIAILRAYKFAISPLFPPACRYVPSCSEYAIEAVDRHGIFRGLMLALWRLLRCHPFVKGGFDPVPLSDSGSGASPDPSLINCHH